MKIQLPENPNIYLILFSFIIFICGALLFLSNKKQFNILYWICSGLSLILFFIGFVGLKKTNDLKNLERLERINLLKAQQKLTLHEANKTHVIRL